MKALSIRQPWAWLIAAGVKDIENRTWPTKVRGRVYIHAGLAKEGGKNGPPALVYDLLAAGRLVLPVAEQARFTYGGLIGEVDIVDCVRSSTSPWYEGNYGFVLANALWYATPIPCKGQLGFFEPPADVQALATGATRAVVE